MKQVDPTEFYNYTENHPDVWNILTISQQRTGRQYS